MPRSSRLLNLGGRLPLATHWSRFHAAAYRLTRGRFIPKWFGSPVMVIETVGRKTGRVRRAPVIRVEHGDDLLVIPANAGSHRPPAWWLNLRAAGEGYVIHKGRRQRVRAREAEGEERTRLWSHYTKFYPGVDDYTGYTDRELPLVVLEPLDESQ
jgi:deazaflavin-dependent oxidoreductase (nitroreductase family)